MNFKRILTLLLFGASIASLPAQGTENTSSKVARLAAASEMLQPDANDIAIYTKGAICGSCGVGIRIMLSKVDGVDKKKYQKGVLLDVENQLTVLAFRDGIEPDMDAVFQAVYDAGYDPEYFFRHSGETVERIDYNFTPKE